MNIGTFVAIVVASTAALLTSVVLVAASIASSASGKPSGRLVSSESILFMDIPFTLQSVRGSDGKVYWWWSSTMLNNGDCVGPFKKRELAISNVRSVINQR